MQAKWKEFLEQTEKTKNFIDSEDKSFQNEQMHRWLNMQMKKILIHIII